MEKKKKKQASSAKADKQRITEKARRIRRRKRNSAIFYSIYGVCVAAALVAIAIGTRQMRTTMESYEASQPKYAAERAAQTFVMGDYEAMYPYEDTESIQAGHETEAQYVQAMEAFVAGRPISWREERLGDETLKKYIVKAGDERMGEFYIRLTDEEDQFGNKLWAFDRLSTNVLKTQTYTVFAPTGSTVYVDGYALPADALAESGLKLFDTVKLPAGTTVPTMQKWTFSRYFGVENVRVEDIYGRENVIEENGEGQWTAAFNYDDERLSVNEARVIEVVRRLSCFMTNDYNGVTLRRNDMVEGSAAATYVRAYDTAWITAHKGYEFLNMDISNYISYSEDCFSVEARYDYKIIYRSTEEIYPTAYRLYFQRKGDTWLLFDFTLI